MNKAAIMSVFVNSVADKVDAARQEAEKSSWGSLFVDIQVPADIASGHTLTVYGEGTNAGERYFSVWISWNARKDFFYTYSDTDSREDLVNAANKVMAELVGLLEAESSQ